MFLNLLYVPVVKDSFINPPIKAPEDFKKLKNIKLIYKGKLRKYRTRIRRIEAPKPITIIHRRAAV